MSVATPFNFHAPFPFCPSTYPWDVNKVIDDLSLSDVMSLWWNLETVSFSVSSTTAIGSMSGGWSVDTWVFTGDLYFSSYNQISAYSSAWWPSGSTAQTRRNPGQRVCATSPWVFGNYMWRGFTTPSIYIGAILAIQASVDFPGRYLAAFDFGLDGIWSLGTDKKIYVYAQNLSAANGPGYGTPVVGYLTIGSWQWPIWIESEAIHRYRNASNVWVEDHYPGTPSISGTGSFYTYP